MAKINKMIVFLSDEKQFQQNLKQTFIYFWREKYYEYFDMKKIFLDFYV